MRKNKLRALFDTVYYIFLMLMIQLVCTLAVGIIYNKVEGKSFIEALQNCNAISSSQPLLISMLTYSLVTIIVFVSMYPMHDARRWQVRDKRGVILWIVLFAFALILPSTWSEEMVNVDMPENMQQLLLTLIGHPLGFLVIAILVPIAEELVFRGTIQRRLQERFLDNGQGKAWMPIFVSALCFALVHGNMAQGVHAFIIGAIIGYLYLRTRSLIPGLIIHWVNNSLAFILTRLFPDNPDAQLIDIFQGNAQLLNVSVILSTFIALLAFYNCNKKL